MKLSFFLFLTLSLCAKEIRQTNTLILSTPEEIASLSYSKEELIGGFVSPLTGQIVLKQGTNPLYLDRVYIAPLIPASFPEHSTNQEEWDKYHFYSFLAENYKGWLFYPCPQLEYHSLLKKVRLSDPRGIIFDIPLEEPFHPQPGMSNLLEGVPSKNHNLWNTHIYQEEGKITVIAPDGTQTEYLKQHDLKPNITLYLPDKKNLPSLETRTNDLYEKRHYSLSIKEKEGKRKVKIHYHFNAPPLLVKGKGEQITYDDNFLLRSYKGSLGDFSCEYQVFDQVFRVSKLQLTDGSHWEISYAPGMTYAIDSNGNQITYRYSQNCLLDSIQMNRSKKLFSWDDRHFLTCLETYDENGTLTEKHSYEYDSFGNPILEKLNETPLIQREFSSDTGHLLLKKVDSSDRPYYYTYAPLAKKASGMVLPNDKALIFTYGSLGSLKRIDAADETVHYQIDCDKKGRIISLFDETTNLGFKRTFDSFGNLSLEQFSWGLTIKKEYDHLNRPLLTKIEGVGSILYTYEKGGLLESVTRLSEEGIPLYTHTYNQYDAQGRVLIETLPGTLGIVSYKYDFLGRATSTSSPYFQELSSYDTQGNLIKSVVDGMTRTFYYDSSNRYCSETIGSYKYDFSAKRRDGIQYTSDALGRVVEISLEEHKILFSYDLLGRRLSKQVFRKTLNGFEEESFEYYLYDRDQEIGAFTKEGEVKNLRIFGHNPIGIELEGQTFIPLFDTQGNPNRLIELSKKIPKDRYLFTKLGSPLKSFSKEATSNPWRFANERIDKETDLIYVKTHYYDPQLDQSISIPFLLNNKDVSSFGLPCDFITLPCCLKKQESIQ